MEILKQNKAILEDYVSNMTTSNNPDTTSGIYLAAVKVAQYIMVAENRIEKEVAKK